MQLLLHIHIQTYTGEFKLTLFSVKEGKNQLSPCSVTLKVFPRLQSLPNCNSRFVCTVVTSMESDSLHQLILICNTSIYNLPLCFVSLYFNGLRSLSNTSILCTYIYMHAKPPSKSCQMGIKPYSIMCELL